jgi:quinone-modifying oxidoreductase subunit QmoC
MGLKNKLVGFTEPWLCDYCGDCTDSCPRDANPGEMMMSLRRYLISLYDWTGLSKLFLTSIPALISAFVIIAIFVLAIASINQFDTESIMHFGHLFEKLIIAFVAGFILIPNIFRMFWFTILREKRKVPLSAYITKSWDLILLMFTQLKSLKCTDATIRWISHLLVVFGYLTLLITVIFLNWFTTDNTFIIVFIFTIYFIFGRARKNKEVNKFSHSSDWLFVVWLFLMGFSAFLVRLYIDMNLINNNLWLYLIHLIILSQWGIIIVPFGKWTHFLYRPFALYFLALKKAAEKLQEQKI